MSLCRPARRFAPPPSTIATRLSLAAQSVAATIPVRISSEIGREEFVLVALVPGEKGLVAFPTGKGSGAVTSFSQADGFVAIDALSGGLEAGSNQHVTLIGTAARTPDIVIMGSHCVVLDILIERLSEAHPGLCVPPR